MKNKNSKYILRDRYLVKDGKKMHIALYLLFRGQHFEKKFLGEKIVTE